MKKGESLLTDSELQNIDFEALKRLKTQYFEYLEQHPIVFPTPLHTIDFIKLLKRRNSDQSHIYGPYKNISIYEAANRIASDLVILNGLVELIEIKSEYKKATFTLRLGITDHKGHGDFTISLHGEDYEGEAFNVAPSFLKAKLRNTLKKWKDNPKLTHILINEDSLKNNTFKERDARVFIVRNWEFSTL